MAAGNEQSYSGIIHKKWIRIVSFISAGKHSEMKNVLSNGESII